jgi:NADPH:quinone reductase
MRAAVVRKFGGPEAVEVLEVPLPEPGFFEVRVKVAAAALNPADAAVWSGYLGSLEEGRYAGLGLDAAGTIDAVGPGITMEVGTPVIVFDSGTMIPTKAQAEYLVSDLNSIAPAPAGMDLKLAATLPLNAMTASLALDHLRLRPRDTLLSRAPPVPSAATPSNWPGCRARGSSRRGSPRTRSSCAVAARAGSSRATRC